MLRGVVFVAAAGLSGCVPTAPEVPARAYTLVPAENGLDVVGSGGREIGFGRVRAGVLETVARIDGTPPPPAPCAIAGRSAVRADGGLILVFDGEVFAGWATDDAARGKSCGPVAREG